MSYMESAMQDQIDGSIVFQNQICDDACDVYKKTHLMASDLLKQRDELLEALKELSDLMDDVRSGNYEPDSFTTQPARTAISRAEK